MNSFVPKIPLYIDDALVVSSLGFDAATAMAAMRAGLSRPSALTGFSVTAEDGDEMDVSGHPVSLLTHGFMGAGRYRQLLGRIFADIQSVLQDSHRSTREPVYLLVGVPDPRRYREGRNVESGADLTTQEDTFNLFGETWESLVKQSLAANGLSEQFVASKVVELSVAKAPRLLQMAHEALKRDPHATVVVVTVDTLSDDAGLTWLYHTGRLKTAIFPVGSSPGECVNALLIRSSKTSNSSLRVDAIHFDAEEHAFFDDVPPQGRGLSRLLTQHATASRDSASEKLWLISNLTGEQKPSFEWGMAQVHCQSAGVDINEFPWLPAINVGDVGVAFMNLALAWVVQAVKRDYALGPRCGIALLDHRSERSMLSVSRA